MSFLRASVAAALATTLGIGLAGCATDLGACEQTASTALVYDPQGIPFYAGQFVVAKSCADGFCHTAAASRGERLGVPGGLDFDSATIVGSEDAAQAERLRDGRAVIRDWASSMVSTIESGWMPPGEAGQALAVNEGCTEDADLIAALPEGDPLTCAPYGLATVRFDTDDGRTVSVLKNWLACGQPLVERTEPPASGVTFLGDVVPVRTAVEATFGSIWSVVLASDTCLDCHQPGLPATFRQYYEQSGELDLSDREAAYRRLLGVDGTGGSSDAQEIPPDGCRGSTQKLVAPGDPDASILVQKLEGTQTCGERMPILGTSVPQPTIDVIREWIERGAPNDG